MLESTSNFSVENQPASADGGFQLIHSAGIFWENDENLPNYSNLSMVSAGPNNFTLTTLL